MEEMIVMIDPAQVEQQRSAWIAALEAGKVLYVPRFSFGLTGAERAFLRPDIRDPKKRNISLNASGQLAGVAGDEAARQGVAAMIGRFRDEAESIIDTIVPAYRPHLCAGRRATARTKCRPATSPGAPMTAACTWTRSRPGPTTASACCACSST